MVPYPPASLPLATLSEYPSLGESLAFQVNGLIVVFLALSSIWGLMELIGLFFRQGRTTPLPAAAEISAAPTKAAPAASDGPTPELIAVITASVAAVLERPYRIMAILPVEHARDWAKEGRREIFTSHKVR